MTPDTASRIAAMVPAAQRAPHGTRARNKGGCRCLQCRAANSRYVAEREAARAAGDTRELVDASPARRQIATLSRKGMGYKLVAESAGVSKSVMYRIMTGDRTQIRAHTLRRILAVTYDVRALGDKSLIDAGPTWKLLDEMLERGYTKTQLASWLLGRPAHALQVNRDRITARTAMRVERMYAAINDGKMRRD